MDLSARPAQLVLTASVARRYYLDGKSKTEIAGELGLSRFKVARLLEAARMSGLVRIEIVDPGTINIGLSADLQAAFGLAHAVVIDTPGGDLGTLRRDLGQAAAALLTEIVADDDILGLAWSRAVSEMANAIVGLPDVPVVQLNGALLQPDTLLRPGDNSVDLVRNVTRISGGAAHFFYAPTIVPDPATARALEKQPEIARTFAMFGSVTKAVVGVGLWAAGESTVYDATPPSLRRQLLRRGVCGEVCGVLVDAAGRPVASELASRMIGVSAAQLRAIPEVIALAYGTARSPAVRAAIQGGLVSSVVTHSSLAAALLSQP